MNNNVQILLRYVCDGDIKKAKQQARIILGGITTKKDEQFRDDMLRKLDAKGQFIELPSNLKGLLVAEDSEHFPEGKFLLRKKEANAVEEVLSLFRAADRLAEMGIPYLPALILHGESGCGKTELARYIAHQAKLPFVYVRFSNVVSSYLGSTQSNIARIFDYARSAPCVLCFDEIDAVGMARGQSNDVGEMNRIVIALMQELDQLPNNVIIIGTTNRFDRLDPALIRRFPLQYELLPLTPTEAMELAQKFFRYTGLDTAKLESWYSTAFTENIPASSVVRVCTEVVVSHIMKEHEYEH